MEEHGSITIVELLPKRVKYVVSRIYLKSETSSCAYTAENRDNLLTRVTVNVV
jgi:hypothetical protein